jgi:hypothetical protein
VTGAGTLKQLTHKLKGLVQVLYDAHFLHPRIALAGYVTVIVAFILAAWTVFHRGQGHLLKGDELNTANHAFDTLK